VAPSEIATYLAGAGLGLTLGTNLFDAPFPEAPEVPDAAVCLVDWGSVPSLPTYGPSLSPPSMERPQVKVIVRDGRDKVAAARTTAYAVYKKLRRLGPVTLSGVVYHNIDADVPAWLGRDENKRPRFHFDLDVWKAES
jgi:hypothetical protein